MPFAATAHLAQFTRQLSLADSPSGVVERAKLLVLDTLGVALAAASMDIGRKIVGHVESLGGEPRATIWGRGTRTSAPMAALANGTLTSAVDFDPGFHLTTHTLPAAIAIGEQVGANGAQVLEGFVAGYEIGARLIELLDSGRAEGGGITAQGWYHVGFIGPIASALAAGKVLGLSQSQLRSAMGIAGAAAGGLRRNFGAMAKAFQAGHSASQGVHAALLAKDGFHGDPDILEAPLGLLGALGVPEGHAEQALGKLGSTWELLASLKIKRFPACTPAHQPVQAALELQRQHGFTAEDVEAIEADLHDRFSLIRLDPIDEIAGGFSLPFLLAVALVDGELTLGQLTDERVHDAHVRRLMARVRRAPLESKGSGGEDVPEQVTVHLRDGRTLIGVASRVSRFESPAEIEAKFRDCAGHSLSTNQVERLREVVMRQHSLASIGELASATIGRQ